ncbi:hypothetical protein L1887_62291 [Cichorium endivia]|nr:hypothetical protein L1887_62291 [Cichorium endivia]
MMKLPLRRSPSKRAGEHPSLCARCRLDSATLPRILVAFRDQSAFGPLRPGNHSMQIGFPEPEAPAPAYQTNETRQKWERLRERDCIARIRAVIELVVSCVVEFEADATAIESTQRERVRKEGQSAIKTTKMQGGGLQLTSRDKAWDRACRG